MGSPSFMEKEVLINFLMTAISNHTKYNEQDLYKWSLNQLRERVKPIIEDNKPLACFDLGRSVDYIIGSDKYCNDELNALCGAITSLFYLFDIKEDDEEEENT